MLQTASHVDRYIVSPVAPKPCHPEQHEGSKIMAVTPPQMFRRCGWLNMTLLEAFD